MVVQRPCPARLDNPPMHLLIPYANCTAAECQQALATLNLPNLDKLLHHLPLAHTDTANENTLSPPHERALAAAYGITMPNSANTAWPDGETPWGAWHAMQTGYLDSPSGNGIAHTANRLAQLPHTSAPFNAWAVITPCHWTVQTSHITMTHPRALNLGDEESRALLAAMQPFFAEDGIALMYDTPTRWLARGAVFAELATASPYRAIAGHVDDWLPKAPSAKLLRRLQNEMQMLLYTHPLTDARVAQGLPAVNSFWVSGTGALPPGLAPSSQNRSLSSPALTPFNNAGSTFGGSAGVPITVPNALRDAATLGDWSAWAQAWRQIDSTECVALLQASQLKSDANAPDKNRARLTLCGERSAQTFLSPQNGPLNRILQIFRGHFRHLPTSYIVSML